MRDALRAAKRFVRERYPHASDWHFDICEESAGREKSGAKVWSFGVRPDEEDPLRDDHGIDPDYGYVGYVHANGNIEGLYG